MIILHGVVNAVEIFGTIFVSWLILSHVLRKGVNLVIFVIYYLHLINVNDVWKILN